MARTSGWRRSRSRIIPEGARFPEFRCAFRPHRAARESAGFGSAFTSELPRAYAAAEPVRLPGLAEATAWWMSVGCAAR